MTYQTFLDEIQKLIHLKLPEGIITTYRTIQKNNGVDQTGICFLRENEKEEVTPVIYVEPFFYAYKDGESLESLAEKIADALKRPIPDILQKKSFLNRDYILSHTVFRLISKKENESALSELLHRDFLDLAVTYGILLDTGDEGRGIMSIPKELAATCGITETEIHEAALQNAEKLSGSVCQPIENFINCPHREEPLLYVMTNRHGFFGASTMIYSEKIRELADRWESDVFIIPSSIHEIILVRNTGEWDPETIVNMISEVNNQHVQKSEVLSDRLYVYVRENKEYQVVGN